VLLDGQTNLQQALGGLENGVQRPIFGTPATAPNPDSLVLKSSPILAK